MAEAEKDPEFRILSLAGGGYLGFYTACVLAELEEQAGEPLGRRFDLIAGTSVGGILAIALAFEIPMAKIRSLFLENGARIFSSRGLPGNPVAKLRDLTRSVLGPKYNGIALNKALVANLGRRTMAEAKHAVVVPAPPCGPGCWTAMPAACWMPDGADCAASDCRASAGAPQSVSRTNPVAATSASCLSPSATRQAMAYAP